jgi:hypothetical protein
MKDMKKKLNTRLWLGLSLTIAFVCGGDRAAMQQASTPSTPSPAVTRAPALQENCAPWPEILNAAFLQILEHPANGELARTMSAKVVSGELSVRELVAALAASAEYKERFVAARPAEEAARLLYRHLLARDAEAAELSSMTNGAGKENGATDFAAAVKLLVESEEYGQRFGATLVPGSPDSLRPCRFPLKLTRQDAFGDNTMTTELTVAIDGQFQATTKIKSVARKQPFCGKVGLWLFGESEGIVAITGPSPEAAWCAGGVGPNAQQEHAEEWHGSISRPVLDQVVSAALLQRAAGAEPQVPTRENTERAAQIKQTVR